MYTICGTHTHNNISVVVAVSTHHQPTVNCETNFPKIQNSQVKRSGKVQRLPCIPFGNYAKPQNRFNVAGSAKNVTHREQWRKTGWGLRVTTTKNVPDFSVLQYLFPSWSSAEQFVSNTGRGDKLYCSSFHTSNNSDIHFVCVLLLLLANLREIHEREQLDDAWYIHKYINYYNPHCFSFVTIAYFPHISGRIPFCWYDAGLQGHATTAEMRPKKTAKPTKATYWKKNNTERQDQRTHGWKMWPNASLHTTHIVKSLPQKFKFSKST